MQIEQLTLFQEKVSFNPSNFDSTRNNEVFEMLANAVHQAFAKISQIDISEFDSTTRANMLNNLVLKTVERDCVCDDIKFFHSLTHTRRGFFILNDEYLVFMKKYPISNIKTMQDDMIKAQCLDKHIIFLVYIVDVFWSSIKSIKLQYIVTDQVLYEKEITNLAELGNVHLRPLLAPILITGQQLEVRVKEELVIKKEAK